MQKQRGENKDYIPSRQSDVSQQTCDLESGCAFKAKAEKRDPHYRRKGGKQPQDPYSMIDLYM